MAGQSHSPRACPVQDSPQLVVRVLDRSAGEAKAADALELVVRLARLGLRVLDRVNFIDKDTRPGQILKLLDVAPSEINACEDYWTNSVSSTLSL